MRTPPRQNEQAGAQEIDEGCQHEMPGVGVGTEDDGERHHAYPLQRDQRPIGLR